MHLAHADDTEITDSLSRLGIHSADIQPSPISGLKTILSESGVLYISNDGHHIIRGPLYNIGTDHPINITNQLLNKHLEALKNEMIIFKAPKEKHVVIVFTDITCSYCHKLHEQIPEYNSLGITICYLAFPRHGLNSQAGKDMTSVWCSFDQKTAFTKAMNGDLIPINTCKIDISKHYTLGVQYGIHGTPALLLDNGVISTGYQNPKELSEMLDQQVASREIGR